MTTTSAKSGHEKKAGFLHWRIIFTAGMGFFTDAYDLFIIGVVTALLSPLWHLTTLELSLLNGASLVSAAFGAILFGYLADKFGRKKMYGIEVFILFIGAILSAASLSFSGLLVSRIVVGFGIGGDYPSSAVVVSEYSHHKNRGFLVLLVFAMQALGLIVGPSVASGLLALHVDPEIAWRVLLGIGAIPAASVFYLRRTISETPTFLRAQRATAASRVISDLVGYKDPSPAFKQQKLISKKWLWPLVGTAGAWFLLDVAFYGNGVSSVIIINSIDPHATLLAHTILSALIFLCFAVPGYIFSALFVDKIGRKRLQNIGFVIIALCYLCIAFIPNILSHLYWFVFVFGMSFFFVNFGPNATTFLIPSEVFPTSIRAKAHGISAAVGKIGAFVGAFLLPTILKFYGLPTIMWLLAIVCILGVLITKLIPEMKGVSLDATEESSHT